MSSLIRISLILGLATALLIPASAPPLMLQPGSTELTTLAADSAASFAVQRLRIGDSLPRPLARMTWSVASARGDSGTLTLVTDWSPPVSNTDSLTIDRHSFTPREESLISPTLHFRYRYEGRHVAGSLQRGDSTPEEIARDFDGPVFAFNEVGPLVRSLRFRASASYLVPLFSEADAAFELDTVTVVSDTAVAGRAAWVVRFADPVIVQRYVIDAATRRVHSLVTTQRKSGTAFVATP